MLTCFSKFLISSGRQTQYNLNLSVYFSVYCNFIRSAALTDQLTVLVVPMIPKAVNVQYRHIIAWLPQLSVALLRQNGALQRCCSLKQWGTLLSKRCMLCVLSQGHYCLVLRTTRLPTVATLRTSSRDINEQSLHNNPVSSFLKIENRHIPYAI